jgi:hypothetical protein
MMMVKSFEFNTANPGLDRGSVNDWEGKLIGKGIWQYEPLPNTAPYLTMTGSAVTLDAYIPTGHRLVRFEWKHTTSAGVDGLDATAVILSRIDKTLLWRIYAEAASTSSTTVVPFGEGYEYHNCRYRVSFNTSNTDLVYPKLWVQEVKP